MKSALIFVQRHVLPAVVFFGLALALAQTDWLQRFENITLDLRTRWRTRFQPEADPAIVILGIDDNSLKIFDRWPWPRRVHGQMLYAVAQAKPGVVAWDILFTEPSEQDLSIVAGAKQMPGKVIFAAYSSDEPPDPAAAATPVPDRPEAITRIEGDPTTIYSAVSALLPVAPLRAAGLTAFVDTPAGPDGVRRVAPMLVRVQDRVYPSLSLQTVLRYWDLSVADVRVRVGDAIYVEGAKVRRRIPIDASGGYLVNYRRSIAGFNVLSYSTVVTDFTQRYLQKQDLKVPEVAGKILLVGQMSTGLSDNGPTPFSPETPLVLVHANVVENILREDYARQLPEIPVWLGGVGVGVAGGAVLRGKDAPTSGVGVGATWAGAGVGRAPRPTELRQAASRPSESRSYTFVSAVSYRLPPWNTVRSSSILLGPYLSMRKATRLRLWA